MDGQFLRIQYDLSQNSALSRQCNSSTPGIGSMYNYLKEMEAPEPHIDTASHEEHAKTIGEERLVSTPDVQRAIHATDREIADVILGGAYGLSLIHI